MTPAVFLDRDGTINLDKGYVHKPEDFFFLPKAIEALNIFRELGYLLIMITNQSGIGRGYYSLDDYFKVTEKMNQALHKVNISFDDIYYCPHSPESGCACRKPGNKMIEEAIKKWDINRKASFMVGDKRSDIEAGRRSQVKTFLISPEPKEYGQDFTVPNLFEVATLIQSLQSREFKQ